MPARVISVSHLAKRYGSTIAVDDVSLEVHPGEIFGLIGPNGAGKTTTMECVEGLRKADRGTISVLGLDPRRDSATLRQRIGVQHQEANLQKRIKVWEAVDLWSTLYAQVVDTDALLARLGLEAKRNAGAQACTPAQSRESEVTVSNPFVGAWLIAETSVTDPTGTTVTENPEPGLYIFTEHHFSNMLVPGR